MKMRLLNERLPDILHVFDIGSRDHRGGGRALSVAPCLLHNTISLMVFGGQQSSFESVEVRLY